MFDRIKEIYQYRELLINLTKKELKLKYKNSVIGVFWSFLNPLMMLVIYNFAFKYIMKINIPNFPIYLLSGLLPWIFFSSSISMSSMSIVFNANLIKKVYFPREIIPLSIILSNFVNLLITLIVLFVGIFVYQVKLGLPLLLLPLMLFILLCFSIGLGLLLSAYTVTYRDISHLLEVIFAGWFYVTPIVYPFSMIPDRFHKYIMINPITPIVEGLHDILVFNQFPDIKYILLSVGMSLFFLVLGFKVFKRRETNFAEEA